MATNMMTFCIRVNSFVIEAFRNQASEEHITQGELFTKILNSYLGVASLEEDKVPFRMHMFLFDNINKKQLTRRTYKGYGVPLYFSQPFRFFGKVLSSDIEPSQFQKRMSAFTPPHLVFNNAQEQISSKCSELVFKQLLYNYCWRRVSDLEPQGIEELQRDFNIAYPENYSYISAFRVFREVADPDRFLLTVNEQIYFITNNCLSEPSEDLGDNAYFMRSAKEIYAEDMDFSQSFVCKISDISEGEKKLKLDRKYLNPDDVFNLKTILKPMISKDDNNIDEILAEYSIHRD